MNEAIEKMAATIIDDCGGDPGSADLVKAHIERFAQAAAKRCAEICSTMGDGPFAKGWDSEDYAAAILAEFAPAPSQGGG